MNSQTDGPARKPLDGFRAAELESLVSAALELRDLGRADWLEEACRRRPDAAAEVRAVVERADALPGLLGESAGLDPMRGACLGGRFRLRERLGVGSMGVVYLAEDLDLRRQVACKVVHHGLLPPQQALERFAREAQAMAAVQHPAVVTIHDRGRTETDQVYIVMELLEGPPLSEVLVAARAHGRSARGDDCSWLDAELGVATRGETSYVRTVVRWIAELALGLEAVHRAGVLHRDIKPSNIIVRRDGRPVLLDFGIALLDEQGSGTRLPSSVGTPAYMPPEALLRDAPRTAASDVYSLAATLYHLLTLHAPYEGTPTQILAALASRDPLPAAQRRPGLPRDLQAVLDRGMHRKSSRRYASAAAFEADLRAFLEYRPVSARPVTSIERAWRRLVRSRVALGALATLVLGASAFGVQAWRGHVLDGRRARHAEIARHFPPNFTVVGLANRVYRYDADRDALAALLDEAASVAVEPLPTLLLRASFRQDHGDPQGAASDMRRVADFVATPFARALAERYAAADAQRRGIAAIELADLPAPGSPTDRYLLGYHHLRQGKATEALELLADSEVRRIPHAEELFLAFTNFDGLSTPDQFRLALSRYENLVRLESNLGGRTAATAHIAGRMLAMQDRFDDASAACAQGIALAPRTHTLRINAGYSAFVQGRLAEAREHLDVGRDLRPNDARIVENLVWVELAQRRFDAAALLVREKGPGLDPADPDWTPYWSGVVATYAALDAHAEGDAAAMAREIGIARDLFARVPKIVLDEEGRPSDTAYRIALALGKADDQAVLSTLLELLAERPLDWWRQQLVLAHLPNELDASATEALRGVLEALDLRTLAGSSK